MLVPITKFSTVRFYGNRNDANTLAPIKSEQPSYCPVSGKPLLKTNAECDRIASTEDQEDSPDALKFPVYKSYYPDSLSPRYRKRMQQELRKNMQGFMGEIVNHNRVLTDYIKPMVVSIHKPDAGDNDVSGSGFIYRGKYIITNHHVLDDGSLQNGKVAVTFLNGKIVNAKIVGFDKQKDIMVLRVNPKKLNMDRLPSVDFAPAHTVEEGDPVVAVGHPLGHNRWSMTFGNVTSDNRHHEASGLDLFQIDADLSVGNSGGPTFNMFGEVAGINIYTAMPSMAENIGFCVRPKDLKPLVDKIIDKFEQKPKETPLDVTA
ncbi:MAG: S1C family serine protease [Vampirovibrio sp.]|nr:S1C family serine protease [Vampirovibrio sp.]